MDPKFDKGEPWAIDGRVRVGGDHLAHLGLGPNRDITDNFNERKEKYGTCPTCKEYNTNKVWCRSCDPKLLAQSWTSSGNEKLDEIIRNTQLEAKGFDSFYYIKWIPYDDLKNIKKIGKGGFATVHKGEWSTGPRFVSNNKRYYYENSPVALKKLENSQNVSDEFLKELQNHIKFKSPYKGVLDIYGISQDPNTKEYILVVRYASNGSLSDYLTNIEMFKDLKWRDKIRMLHNIILGLNNIHQEQLVHRDLHSGNVLHSNWLPSHHQVMISDLGLTVSADQEPSSIIGVVPYIAPEVLSGRNPYTQKSDIYSFGVLMSVISTGQQPFNDKAHDHYLMLKICEGLRPAFSNNTPKIYIELAYKCMDADPDNRPTADEILKTITFWKDADDFEYIPKSKYSEEQLDELRKIKEIFDQMDDIKYDPSTILVTKHPSAIYTSRKLKSTNLPQPINSNKVTIIGSSHDSQQVNLNLDQLKL